VILAPTPFVRPATQAQSFPVIWVSAMSVAAPAVNEGTLYFEFSPFNPDTGEIAAEAKATLAVQLWECVNEVPEAAAAMQAVFAAIPAIKAWQEAKEAQQPPPI